jgi:hypothetical protein
VAVAHDFPELVIEPGDHLGEWKHQHIVLSGQIQLAGDAQPRIDLKGEFDLHDLPTGVRSYPVGVQEVELRGWLWSGHQVLMRDVHLETVFPDRTVGFGRYALVGLNLDSVPNGLYRELVFQVTGLDLLLGRPPLGGLRTPPHSAKHLEGEFVAIGNPESTQRWELDGTTITCSYWARHSSVHNPYKFELRFAPVVHAVEPEPLDLDGWLDRWVTPLVRLLAMVTREPQRLSWVELRHQDPADDQHWPVRAQVFGTGVTQEPYVSEDAEAWRDPRRQPILDLNSSGLSLPALVSAWRDLDAAQNPFVELFRLVMFQRDLPKRAQFLYLVQALEALHGYESRVEDQRLAETYVERRAQVIEEVRSLGGSTSGLRFLKQSWPQRPSDNLSRRIRALVDHPDLPTSGRVLFDSLVDTALAKSAQQPDVENVVRQIRNDLAHGARNYSDRELRPWTSVLDAFCRAHLLRLLGCPVAAIGRAFHISQPDR